MERKPKKNMGLLLLAVAILFLFEPSYTLFDPLPDLMGYILLCAAIIDMADLNSRISDAFIGFRRGIVLAGLRSVTLYLVNTYFEDVGQSLWILVFVFCFEFFELWVLLPAYKNLFQGLLTLGMMQDGSAVYAKKAVRRSVLDPDTGKRTIHTIESTHNVSEKLSAFTTVFLILSALCTTLPEMTSLINNADYEFLVLVRALGMIFSSILGVIWLVNMQRYLSNIRKDSLFLQNLNQIYMRRAMANPGFYLSRSLRSGIAVLFAGALFFADFYINFQNVIPEVCGYLLFIIGAWMLGQYTSKAKWLICSSTVGILLSLLSKKLASDFYSQYEPIGVTRDLKIYNTFYRMTVIQAISAAIVFLTFFSLILLLWELYRKYTDAARAVHLAEHQKKCNIYAIWSGITAFLASFASVYYILAQPFYEIRDGRVISQGWYFYYSATISIIVNLIGVLCICSFLLFTYQAIKERYEVTLIED